MKITDLDRAVVARNHRRNAIEVRECVKNHIFDCSTVIDGERIYLASYVPTESIRAAALGELNTLIAEKENDLAEMGVEIE
jgi:hypothetical protein